MSQPATDHGRPTTDRLFLMGYRGTGKSTVARLVAEGLDWEHVDADDEVERVAGKAIRDLFAEQGEPAFRDLEERVVAELALRQKTVVALGGGAVLRPANRECLKQAGPVVWLTAAPDTIAKRLEQDASTASRRPSLTGGSVLEEIVEVLAVREPLYRECATLVVDTEGKSAPQVAAEILSNLTHA
ncbi:MAG: shikimate kinase [Planctomycetales bacterium]|nr:shikimate kinase [Planctomycetales bacterium]